MISRYDESRLLDAHGACDYVIARVREDGRFYPPEGQWPESSGYQAENIPTLTLAGRIFDDERYTKTARRIIQRFLDERVEGLWSLDYWKDFPVKQDIPPEAYELNNVADPRYTALILKCIGLYHKATGDETVVEPAREAMRRMFARWDFMGEEWLHMTRECAALAVLSWEHILPEFTSYREPIIDWVVDTFVEEAPNDFPFVQTVRTLLLTMATGDKYLTDVIKPGIDALLAEPSRRFDRNGNDFRHTPAHKFLTGDDHVDVRGNGAVALTFKVFDLTAGEELYTGTPLYAYLSRWFDDMKAEDGGWFEGVEIATGRRFGRNSPAHNIPMWWIFGGLSV